MSEKEFLKQLTQANDAKKKKTINLQGNLFCVVLPSGKCTFSVRISTKDKDTRKTIGYYPELNLKDARLKAKEIQEKFKQNTVRAHDSTKPLFGAYSDTWKETKRANPELENSHKNNKWYRNVCSSLKVLTKLREYHLDQITPTLVDKILSEENRTQYTKHHAIQILNQCLNSAEVEGLIDRNNCKYMLKSTSTISLKYRRPKVKGRTWTNADKLKTEFFSKLENSRIKYKYFVLLLTLTLVRDGTLASSQWEWVDFSARKMHIPGFYMKMSRDFDIPITLFTEFLLKKWKKYCEENGVLSKYIFTSETDLTKPMNLAGIQSDLRNATHSETSLHGLRKSGRSWMSSFSIQESICEMILSHKWNNALIDTYNKYDYFAERLSALRLWGFFIYSEQLPKSFKVIFNDIDPSLLKRYKNDFLKEKMKIEINNKQLY